MRVAGLGVIEDGFAFTEAAIARASPRFWWGARKRAAYERVLEHRGLAARRGDREEDAAGGDRHHGVTAAMATVAMADSFAEKRHEGGWSDAEHGLGGGYSDGGTSSSASGGADGGGGGGSGE